MLNPTKRMLTESVEESSFSDAKRTKHEASPTTSTSLSLQDPSLMEIMEKFREVSVKEIKKIKQSSCLSHGEAVDTILKKLRSKHQNEEAPSEEKQEDDEDATVSQFLPGEIELVMELAAVSSRENATRILILREEIYKLRKKGFKTPTIIQVLIRRLMDQIENIDSEENCSILPSTVASSLSKFSPSFASVEEKNTLSPAQNSPPGFRTRKREVLGTTTVEGKRQKKYETTLQQQQQQQQLPLREGLFRSTTSTPSVDLATTTTTTTTTTTMTMSAARCSPEMEGTHLRLDAESIEKMKQLKEMRKTRLQSQQSSLTSMPSQLLLSNSTKRGDHPHYNSEKHRLAKKPRGENILVSSSSSSSFTSPFNVTVNSSPQPSSSSHLSFPQKL
eukprot:TRINITY_DN1603_c0_g1_i1.p1 TRINITY_DN1603_c0_g1~~TRINITY_DN1603_c0_g1_i1.p1  ORF type:complete len:390 (-),score=106.17 TRINITY_DN1603_c0_g1_i1:109-1278(-)